MPNNVVRFPANVPYAKWPSLYGVFTAMSIGDWTLAQQRWNAETQNCLDTAGAIQSWYEKYTPDGYPVVLEDGMLTHGAPVPFTTTPGSASAFKSAADGLASASIGEGGEGLYGMVSDTLPTSVTIEQFTTWGKVAVEGLAIKAGQYLVVYSQSATALSGRADTRVG